MDDRSLSLDLNEALASRVRAAADVAGKSASQLAIDLIEEGLAPDWAKDEAIFAEYDRTGISIPAEEALARCRAAVSRHFEQGG